MKVIADTDMQIPDKIIAASLLAKKSTAKPAIGGPIRLATPLIAVRRPKAALRRSGPRILMNIGDMAATQQPVRRPNKLAQMMNATKVWQTERQKRGMTTVSKATDDSERGCSQDLSHNHPETNLPIVLLIPVAEIM